MSQSVNTYEKENEFLKKLCVGKQTKAVFALGAAGYFLMCGACFATDPSVDSKDNVRALSSSVSESFLEDDEDDYRVKQLKEHNAKQAAKIRLLKQELIEKTQNIYEIKSQLFKQLGDPRDKEKIAELNDALAQKEKQMELLRLEIQQHESAVEKIQKELTENEKSQEQELIALKKQIDILKASSQHSHKDFEKKSRLLESTQHHLTEALEHKTKLIESLERDLSVKQSDFVSKDEALQETTQRLANQEEENKHLVMDLMMTIDQVSTLEETLRGLALDVGVLEDALASSQELVDIKSKELIKIEENASQSLADKDEERKHVVMELMMAMDQVSMLEETIKGMALDVGLLEEALASSQELVESQSKELAKVEENTLLQQQKFEDEIAQKGKLAEALMLEKQNILMINSEFNDSQASLVRRLEEEKEMHKALTAALLEQQRLALTLDEALETKVEEIKRLENDFIEVQKTVDKNVIALKETQKIKQDLEEAHKIIMDNYITLNEYENGVLALQDKIEEEAARRRATEQALKDKEAQGIELAEAVLALIQDADRFQNEALESQKLITENSAALNEFKDRTALLERELQNEREKHKALLAAMSEKQKHISALDDIVKAQAADAERLEIALTEAKGVIDQHSIILQETKNIEEELEKAQIALSKHQDFLLEQQQVIDSYEMRDKK